MTVTYDVEGFYAGLVEHGLIVPVGVPGAFGRGAVFEDVLERFDALVRRVGAPEGAESITFPPIVDRRVIEKVHYLDSFPHLCGAVQSFFGDALQALALAERVNRGQDWGDLLGQTGVVLAPACCYPLYPTLAGTLPAQGRLVTLVGWAYRHEPSPEPTRMQSFRVREYIRAGSAEQVLAWRDEWLQRGLDLLRSLGLPAQTDVAADPFFGRRGKLLATNQKDQKLKFEVLVPVISLTEPTAVCSFNFHQDHFGATFGIRTAGGQVASTACLGFGLERVTMALFKMHGFRPQDWPASVRAQLWT
ncbi:amino acid--[acyl-carrier-protein] ligase [uncultured Methylibium sp.]|uniref:amino acid--[acyl-carrier-protein] ligase n=1 Tax=uncultured Methylibium sp. TaxID=381093 RepID=UPI0025D79A5D|nr:amino acid--[acyl-carrier-protein] ligase [uncultured Methylibium sp.]